MKKLFSPRFSLLFITLPQALLAAALFYAYKSAELTPSLPLMIIFGAQALLNSFIIVCAALNKGGKIIRMLQLTGFIAMISAAAPFLLEQFDFATSLSPEAIYGVLCLTPLIYIATSILHHNEIPLIKIKTRILICVCVPLIFAVAPLIVMSGLFDGVFNWAENVDWLHSAASIILILLFALFFVFVCLVASILYHFRTQKNASEETRAVKNYPAGYYVFIAVLALVLPLLCLLLNNEAFGGFLGDFSGKWFYILALMNGIAMLVPRKNKWLTLITLFFKSAGFLYVIYFVVTMIPYAPLGVAFYAYLVPLLVLTPVALFAAELFQIIDDFQFLKQHFTFYKISVLFACGMLALCAGFAGNGYVQKVNFDKALYYLDGDVREQPAINVSMLKSSLRYMRYSNQFWGWFGSSAQNLEGAPILNEIYHRVIFGGQMLSDESYEHLQRIFLPERAAAWHQPPGFEFSAPESVKLQDIKTEARFDEAAGAYKAWVHLTLKNETSYFNQEYAVKFTLPEGVFVSDYYLDVYGERKYGIVSEKNAAKSLYQSIVNRSRDPGIIYYESGSTVELRVFPFGAGETRETGLELMFLQSDSFTLGGHTITLEGDELSVPIVAGGTCFMPASYKENLEAVSTRTPKYYFIADIRKPLWDEEPTLEQRLALINNYAKSNDITDADVYLTSYNVQKTDLAHLDAVDYGDGGFHLALAMDMIYEDAKTHPGSYPVIIIASGNLYTAAIADNRRFTRDFPEVEHFYLLSSVGALTPHHLADGHMDETASASPQAKRLSHNGFYFRDDGQNEISFHNTTSFADISYGDDDYTNALLLSEKVERAATEDQIIETVRDGISRRLLTKNNSFIVLETKEQEDELNRRNKEFLEGKASGASAASMSEPGLFITLLLTIFLLGLLWMRRKKYSHSL
ncbi:MAG: MSEP-CTERM sorting domain-containing protein [Oscillospiraceae bacterium]|nr:MSEP-CTERM sorting domain-containing protein [Oscillospiraceae bacterium]